MSQPTPTQPTRPHVNPPLYVLSTADAVTPMPGLVVPMTIFAFLYLGLAAIVVTLIRSLVGETT